MRPALPALLLALAPAAALSREPVLNPPVDCSLGESCFIQAYVDTDPGPGAADFTCGLLASDGHKGTDFALPSLAAMAAGVDVLAAAPGVVRAVRDGEPDRRVSEATRGTVEGRECGNGLVVDHGGGWETQYCHLRAGSVSVVPGQRVAKGSVLGQIGLSGLTSFPHLHLSVRRDGAVVDPFNPGGRIDCEAMPDRQLWQDEIAYRPGGFIAAGLAGAVPDYEAVKQGLPVPGALEATQAALVIWAYFYGARAGDVVALAIAGPDGPILTREAVLERDQAQAYRAIGRPRGDAPWPAGRYTGTARLIRDGDVIDTRRVTAEVGP